MFWVRHLRILCFALFLRHPVNDKNISVLTNGSTKSRLILALPKVSSLHLFEPFRNGSINRWLISAF